jgi:eukaryotic-like serine/threonine-protein kinase
MASKPNPERLFEFGRFRLDPRERLCLRDDRAVPMTPKAFDLLLYLVERHGHLVEKQELMHALWPNSIVEEGNLAFTISVLRKVLDDGADGASAIQTIPTRGYRFVAPVRVSTRSQAAPGSRADFGTPVPGETLAARLTSGPLPLKEALGVGIGIARALEVLHRQGIVHLGLTPDNVVLTPEGPSLLNVDREGATSVEGIAARSPIANGTSTTDVAVVGALPYMAPEQIQNLETDERTDLYALGAILYEMVSGQRTLEAPLVPPALDHIVKVCLKQQPADRWQTAHDVKLQLQWVQAEAARLDPGATVPVNRRRTAWALWALATAFAALAATTLLMSPRIGVTPAPPLRFDLTLPPEMRRADYDTGVISPDGRQFLFEATVAGRPQLVLRDMRTAATVPIEGTEGAFTPFWSFDSKSIAFFDIDGHLKQVPVTGGPIRVLAKTLHAHGSLTSGTWGVSGILFGSSDGRIYRVPSAGGTPAVLDTLLWKAGRFASPRFLPDGRRFLVTVVADPALYVASLDAPGLQKIMEDGAPAEYAAGHLFYSRATGIFARPFDPGRLIFTGAERQVTEAAGDVSVSDHGTIVYRLRRYRSRD